MADFQSSRAVIVGINAYSNGVPALRSAVNDAQGLAKILVADHDYSVTLLTDREATLAGLNHHFEEVLPQQVGDNDRVLVYFAGHGIAEEGDDGPTGYLLPQDARCEDPASWLRMETFREWLGKLDCRHLLVVLDCCFAGAFRWTKGTRHIRPIVKRIHRERYERFIRHPAWQAIASAAYDQKALDVIADGEVLGRRRLAADNTPNSPFARALFKGLKGEADLTGDGVIMAYGLATFLRDRVSRSADDARHEQMPCIWSLGKEDSGEFIFLLPHFDPDTLKPAPVLDAENNPYRGLRVYEENDAGLFFGRKKVVEDLAAVVRKQPLTMVLGASGTGKSSLVRAGLLSYPRKLAAASVAADADAELATDAVLFGEDAAAEGVFHRLLIRPADAPATPLRGLMMRLSKAGAEAPGVSPSESATDETLTSAVSAFSAWFAADPKRHLLLVIDQFEELVTLCNNEVRTTFLKFLAELLDRERERLRIVLTLRSDFEPQFTDSALQRHLQAGVGTSEARFLVPPLQHDEFREIIEKPASERVLFFEPPALVDRLITEVIQMPGALPLLSFALSELYLKYVERQTFAQQRGEIIDRAITEEDYRQLGGVVGALSKRATEEYDACNKPYRDTMQRVMLRMVATEGELARRRVQRSELEYPTDQETKRAKRVVKRLEEARLVVSGRTDGGGTASGKGDNDGNGDDSYVEPAHEALVRSWGKLLDWQRKAAAELPVQRRLTEAAAEWTRRKRDSGLLWTSDPRLPLVRQQLTAPDSWLNKREAEFVEASTRMKRRNMRLRRAAIAGLVLLTFAAVAAAVVARERQRVAVRNESRVLSALSDTAFKNGRYDDAVKLALAAWPRSGQDTRPKLPATVRSLGQAYLAPRQMFGPLRHDATVFGAVFNHDESRILTWSDDRTARLWDAATGQPIGVPMQHEGVVRGAVFNHDESRILTWSDDRTARLWDAATGQPIGVPMQHEGVVRGAVFKPDEPRILTWSDDGTARLWDAATGGPLGKPMSHDGVVRGAVFNHDESRILTWSEDGTARLWDAATGQPIGVPMQHEEVVRGAVFKRDERRILTWSDDGTARLWDAATGQPLGEAMSHKGWIEGAVFNHDESRILTWSGDKTARLWDAATGRPIGGEPMRHEGRVSGAVFSRDESENRILTWSRDRNGAARLWDAATGRQIGEPMRHDDGTVWGAVLNRDGTRVLTWSDDGTVRLWDATGRPLRTMWHEGVVLGAEFNRDESRILTRSRDGAVRLWDAATGWALATMRHEKWMWVSGAVFNGNESRILSWSRDGTVRLWDAATGQPPGKVVMRHDGVVLGAVFNSDGGRILTWSGDKTARLWDAAATSEPLATMWHQGVVLGAKFNPDESRILTWSEDGTARLWDAATGQPIGVPMQHEGVVRGAVFKRDERRILTWSDDGTARLWDAATGQPLGVLMQHKDSVSGAEFNPDGSRILTWSWDNTARLWDAATGHPIGEPMRHERHEGRHEGRIVVLGALFKSRILTWSEDGTARLWDAATGQPLGEPMRHKGVVKEAVFNRDESRVLTWSEDRTARLWDAATGQPALGAEPMGHDEVVRGAVFTRDESRIFTWSNDGMVRLWDTAGRLIGMDYGGVVVGAVFNRDESRILTWSNSGTVQLWDAATGHPIGEPVRQHEWSVNGAVFSSDESRILTWSNDGTARLWAITDVTGHLFQLACHRWQDRDLKTLSSQYGIEVSDLICVQDPPPPPDPRGWNDRSRARGSMRTPASFPTAVR